jgi:hypothetical protein
VIRVDGTLGWIYSRAIPIIDADGGIAEWFGAATDVTRRKEDEQRLRNDLDAMTRLQKLSTVFVLRPSSHQSQRIRSPSNSCSPTSAERAGWWATSDAGEIFSTSSCRRRTDTA